MHGRDNVLDILRPLLSSLLSLILGYRSLRRRYRNARQYGQFSCGPMEIFTGKRFPAKAKNGGADSDRGVSR